MSKVIGWIYLVKWLNPYQRPEGKPQYLGGAYVQSERPGQGCPPPPPHIAALHTPGDGYSIGMAAVEPEPKRWTPERKFAYRRKRMEARVRKKAPLFADEFIRAELARKPEYFGQEAGDVAKD